MSAHSVAGTATQSQDATSRAAERITLACRALSAAAEDLRLEHVRSKRPALDDAANRVATETERVCELAEDLVKLATRLSAFSGTGRLPVSANGGHS